MASPTPRKASLSSEKVASVGMKNYLTGKQLEADLERLERERRSKLRELNQESKHFIELKLRCHSARSRDSSPTGSNFLPSPSPGRENSFSRSDRSLSPSTSSLSSRSPSSSPPKSRSPSPRPPFLRKSLSTEEDPKNKATKSSLESRDRLLPKRQLSPKTTVRSQSLTETTLTPLSLSDRHTRCSPRGSFKTTTENILRNNAGLLDISTSSKIPQIVINDVSSNHPPTLEPKIPKTQRNTSGKSKDSKLETPDGSLAVPKSKFRRNSLPAVPIPPSYLRSIAKRESTFVTGDIDKDYRPIKDRPRSSSICVPYFDHLKDAPRRDSLLRKYLARRGSYRRTSVTLERLIADLARGVHHTELLNGNFGRPLISEAEWEKLKECRYLRMPSQDEDVVGNALDVEEIFSPL